MALPYCAYAAGPEARWKQQLFYTRKFLAHCKHSEGFQRFYRIGVVGDASADHWPGHRGYFILMTGEGDYPEFSNENAQYIEAKIISVTASGVDFKVIRNVSKSHKDPRFPRFAEIANWPSERIYEIPKCMAVKDGLTDEDRADEAEITRRLTEEKRLHPNLSEYSLEAFEKEFTSETGTTSNPVGAEEPKEKEIKEMAEKEYHFTSRYQVEGRGNKDLDFEKIVSFYINVKEKTTNEGNRKFLSRNTNSESWELHNEAGEYVRPVMGEIFQDKVIDGYKPEMDKTPWFDVSVNEGECKAERFNDLMKREGAYRVYCQVGTFNVKAGTYPKLYIKPEGILYIEKIK